jgi:hypothetical protein
LLSLLRKQEEFTEGLEDLRRFHSGLAKLRQNAVPDPHEMWIIAMHTDAIRALTIQIESTEREWMRLSGRPSVGAREFIIAPLREIQRRWHYGPGLDSEFGDWSDAFLEGFGWKDGPPGYLEQATAEAELLRRRPPMIKPLDVEGILKRMRESRHPPSRSDPEP